MKTAEAWADGAGWLPDSDREAYVEDHILGLLDDLFVFTDNPADQP